MVRVWAEKMRAIPKKEEPQRELVDVNELIRENDRPAAWRGGTIFDFDKDLLQLHAVRSDTGQISSKFGLDMNLMLNAIEAMDESNARKGTLDQVAPESRGSTVDLGQRHRYRAAPDRADKIFDPFAFPPADHPEIFPGNPASNFGVASRKMFCNPGIVRWRVMLVPGGLLVSYKGLDAEVGEPVPRCANQRGSWKRQNPGVHDSPCPDPSYRVQAARRSNSGNCPSNCVRGRNGHRGKGREPDRCRRRQFCGKSANRPKMGSYPRTHGFYDSPSSEHRSDRNLLRDNSRLSTSRVHASPTEGEHDLPSILSFRWPPAAPR